MEEINYIGEHLGPRILGHIGLLTAFVGALLGMVSYFLATRYRDEVLRAKRWQFLGRTAFTFHALGLVTLIGCIIFAMLNQYYEYQYVQAHVSPELPKSLIFSAFWEGQEGSFLLWLFWHMILGLVLLLTAKRWESPVMAVLCSAQVIISSMILGVYLGFGEEAIRLGSNPMLLLREVIDDPLFAQQDYVELLRGSGLNPSLQNYWMTIHPPTLFLGFASTIVPAAFAIAGLWTAQHKAWLRPALRWALFSGGILGIGILMGGAWAYEALNFGGYWAWDPVENTSLVPWLLLVAGLHTNLVANATGQAIRATYAFYLFTFVLIIYSTFLTRSGILGDTSVHAFTEMGLESQLLFFLGFYFFLSIGMLAWRWKSIPKPEKEESVSSKEFWMFMGSLTLLLSVLFISGITSLPVFNSIIRLFDPGWADKSLLDPEAVHNQFQLPIAIAIAFLTGLAQWLRWRATSLADNRQRYLVHSAIGLGGALVFSFLTMQWIEAPSWQFKLLLFAGWYTVIVNLDYLISFVRKDAKVAGSSLSHLGFGLMLVGILATSVNKRILSRNQFLMEGLTQDEELARTTLRLNMGEPQIMEDYRLTLQRDTIEDFTRTYFVDYERFNEKGEITETFELRPTVLYAKDFSEIVVTNPSTQRYWDKDIFTVIMSMPPEEQNIEAKQAQEDSLKYRTLPLLPNEIATFIDTVQIREPDTTLYREYGVRLVEYNRNPVHPDYEPQAGDIAVGATAMVQRSDREEVHEAQVAIVLREGVLHHYPAQLNKISVRVRISESVFDQLLVNDGTLEYEGYQLRPGERMQLEDLTIEFISFQPSPQLESYQPMEGDIAVGAHLRVTNSEGVTQMLQPVFLVRDNQVMRVRDDSRDFGLFANFTDLNVETDEATFYLAKTEVSGPLRIPLAVAPRALRTDYIGLQAIEFPGINLFWFGALSMMLGMLINLVIRLRQKIKLAAS